MDHARDREGPFNIDNERYWETFSEFSVTALPVVELAFMQNSLFCSVMILHQSQSQIFTLNSPSLLVEVLSVMVDPLKRRHRYL